MFGGGLSIIIFYWYSWLFPLISVLYKVGRRFLFLYMYLLLRCAYYRILLRWNRNSVWFLQLGLG